MNESSQPPFTVHPCAKRVRVMFNGHTLADSRRTRLLLETGRPAVYYFPEADVTDQWLRPSDRHTRCPHKGEAHYRSLVDGERIAENALWSYPEVEALAGTVAFEWDAMDAWFEEDEEVYVHARDPHVRIDALPSSRHVKIVVAGTTVAETRHPVLLFETGLRTRHYLPKVDVRLDLLRPSATISRCPYKGEARYHTLNIDGREYEDIVWYYRYPTAEAATVAGHLCFYDEQVECYVDGERTTP